MGQKISTPGPKAQSLKKLEDERKHKHKEKAATDGDEITIEKVHVEMIQKELKQLAEANSTRDRENKQLITRLEEQVQESCSVVKGLRSDLEDARQKMAAFDNRVGELEARILEEQKASNAISKRAEELEGEIKSVRKQMETEIDLQRVNKEFENEKTAREEAWAKISALEQEMSVAMRDLELERQRLKAATDKIMLVETHLGDLNSTAREMKELFGKQQEQIREMQMNLVRAEEEEEEVRADSKADAGTATPQAKDAEMEPS